MNDEVTVGTMLLEQGTLLPDGMDLNKRQHPSGWVCLDDVTQYDLDRTMRRAGWRLFLMAEEISGTAFGSTQQNAINKAVGRLLAGVKLRKCNCLEITKVALGNFLGLKYSRVSGYARHIQKSLFFGRPG